MHVIRKRLVADKTQQSKIPYDQLTPSAQLELDDRQWKNHPRNVVDLRKRNALRDLEALFSGADESMRTAS